jgi:hypothetical protein
MIGPNPAMESHRALYGPTGAELTAALPEIGESIAAALVHLSHAPTPDGCDRAVMKIEGARQYLVRLQAALLRDSGDGR